MISMRSEIVISGHRNREMTPETDGRFNGKTVDQFPPLSSYGKSTR